MNTKDRTVENAIQWILTYEGEEVALRAEQILAERGSEFLTPTGHVKKSLLLELKEEAWRSCKEVEDVIPLPMTAFGWKEKALPVSIIFSWIERRYGRLAKIAAAVLLCERPNEFVDQYHTTLVGKPLELRNAALEFFQRNSAEDLTWQLYFG